MSKTTIFLAGDSTMSYYDSSRAPRAGWGQMLADFFDDEVTVYNEASSGRSSKSFINEGRLTPIEDKITSNDYLFIQFGHNDEKEDEERHTDPFTTYKDYLERYVNTAKKVNAQPVLITPVQRRKFNSNGKLIETHGEYPTAIYQLATELEVPLIDLKSKSTNLFEQFGPEESKKLFMWLEPNQFKHYPDGEQDDTHFSQEGAKQIARLIIEGIRELQLPLTKHIKIDQ